MTAQSFFRPMRSWLDLCRASIFDLPSAPRAREVSESGSPCALGARLSDVERTPAGLQTIIPGCERRTLPKSTTRVDEGGQGLLHFYKPPTLRERLETRSDAPLRSTTGQK